MPSLSLRAFAVGATCFAGRATGSFLKHVVEYDANYDHSASRDDCTIGHEVNVYDHIEHWKDSSHYKVYVGANVWDNYETSKWFTEKGRYDKKTGKAKNTVFKDYPGDYVDLELDKARLIKAVELTSVQDGGQYKGSQPDSFRVYVSLDGENWEIATDQENIHESMGTDVKPSTATFEFSHPISAKYMKVVVSKIVGGNYREFMGLNRVSIIECRAAHDLSMLSFHFEGLDFNLVNHKDFSTEFMDQLHEAGLSNAQLDKMTVELREGSIIADVSAPPDVMKALEAACGSFKVKVMGRFALVVEGKPMTTPMPTGLPDVLKRFRKMQIEVEELTTNVEEISSGVAGVEAASKGIGSGVEEAEKDMELVNESATNNTKMANMLKEEASTALQTVEVASQQVNNLHKALHGLEKSAMQMGGDSATVGEKVAELEAEVKRLLPGADDAPGGITTRITKAEDTLKAYTKIAEAGGLESVVAKAIKLKFTRATGRVQKLVEEVKKKQMEDE